MVWNFLICFWINTEDGFEVSILKIPCNKRDFFFYKYKANLHIGFALLIFIRGAFRENIKYIIISILDLAFQPNLEESIGNIKKHFKTFYYIFINGYILGLEIY